jgi:hypothetical protein
MKRILGPTEPIAIGDVIAEVKNFGGKRVYVEDVGGTTIDYESPYIFQNTCKIGLVQHLAFARKTPPSMLDRYFYELSAEDPVSTDDIVFHFPTMLKKASNENLDKILILSDFAPNINESVVAYGYAKIGPDNFLVGASVSAVRASLMWSGVKSSKVYRLAGGDKLSKNKNLKMNEAYSSPLPLP